MKHPVRRAALIYDVLLLRSGDDAQNKPKPTALVLETVPDHAAPQSTEDAVSIM